MMADIYISRLHFLLLREMFHDFFICYLHATDDTEVTNMYWVRQMCEHNKIPDGVIIKDLHMKLKKILITM